MWWSLLLCFLPLKLFVFDFTLKRGGRKGRSRHTYAGIWLCVQRDVYVCTHITLVMQRGKRGDEGWTRGATGNVTVNEEDSKHRFCRLNKGIFENLIKARINTIMWCWQFKIYPKSERRHFMLNPHFPVPESISLIYLGTHIRQKVFDSSSSI